MSKPHEDTFIQSKMRIRLQTYSIDAVFEKHDKDARQKAAFLAKIWQTMGTPAINVEASQIRRRLAPQAIFFWRVLARRRAPLREFSADFLSFYTFQKRRF